MQLQGCKWNRTNERQCHNNDNNDDNTNNNNDDDNNNNNTHGWEVLQEDNMSNCKMSTARTTGCTTPRRNR